MSNAGISAGNQNHPIKTVREAINEALHQEMERDPTVIILGEEVAGGAGCKGSDEAYG